MPRLRATGLPALFLANAAIAAVPALVTRLPFGPPREYAVDFRDSVSISSVKVGDEIVPISVTHDAQVKDCKGRDTLHFKGRSYSRFIMEDRPGWVGIILDGNPTWIQLPEGWIESRCGPLPSESEQRNVQRLYQLFRLNTLPDSLGKTKPKFLSLFGGIAYGAESPILGFPQLEVRIRPLRSVPNVSNIYLGVKTSVWWIFFGVGNVGAELGNQYKNLTLDGSWTYSILAGWDSWEDRDGNGSLETKSYDGPYKKLTFNPKIGLQFASFSFRVGPSFKLREYIRDEDRREDNRAGVIDYFFKDGNWKTVNVDIGVGIHL